MWGRYAFALGLFACGSLPVPTQLSHIHMRRHGHLEKDGVPIDGLTCGDRYAQAVTGVSEAAAEIAACRQANLIYGAGMLGFVALIPVGGITSTSGGSRTAIDVEVGVALTSFVVGAVAAWFAGSHLDRAVRVYNDAVAHAGQ
jgi:hypothetical protein